MKLLKKIMNYLRVSTGRPKIPIYAPIAGEIIPLEEVPDTVFSEKIVGDGLAIRPTGNSLVAPLTGTIGKIFDTKHAFSIISPEGIEMFVHFGIDTIALKGEGFRLCSQPGKKVTVGEPIIELDLPFLVERAKSVLTPVVISNVDVFNIVQRRRGLVEQGTSVIFEVSQV